MILQDLIKNVFPYKVIVKPLLRLWKEYLLTSSSLPSYGSLNRKSYLLFLNCVQNRFSSRAEHDIPQQSIIFSFDQHIETHTIVTTNATSVHYLPYATIIKTMKLATNGGDIITMLMGHRPPEQIVTASKTETLRLVKSDSLTIGFITEKISSFLFHETHEKREYLGEFSLPHEEVQVMYCKKGGE